MTQAQARRRRSKTLGRDAHWVEWVTGGLCTLLVLAMMGWVFFHAMTLSEGTPELSVEIMQQERQAGGYRVAFVVANGGKRAAAAVPVTGELKDGERVIESREVTFDYVPAQSSASGALLFATDPAGLKLEMRVAGHTDP